MEIPDRARDLLARAGLGGLSDRAVLLLAGLVAGVVLFAAWRFWPAPGGVDVATSAEVAAHDAPVPADATEATGTAGGATVVVHVVGAVARPGVYTLASGSRVSDAVAAAGGPTGNAAEEGINLARILSDGEQVRMLTKDEVAAGVQAGTGAAGIGAAAAAAGPATGKVDLNRATAAELDALPGVGPSTAQKIVDDRTTNGPFRKIEDLMRVSGIGQKKFDALKDLVTVG
ncbi:MAG: helix-hairpin-helix domain-containing protein [Actinomycetia bacterium]|nr:helix-hairpin-helix domain-containing protein [Actinomycetes bacterium]